MAPRVDLEEASKTQFARLRDLADLLDNRDDLSIENAARNILTAKPAYASMVRGSALGASATLTAYSNSSASLLSVLEKMADFYAVRHIDICSQLLDKLIPLNDAAVDELMFCYQCQSSFRDRDELAGREAKALGVERDAHWHRAADDELGLFAAVAAGLRVGA